MTRNVNSARPGVRGRLILRRVFDLAHTPLRSPRRVPDRLADLLADGQSDGQPDRLAEPLPEVSTPKHRLLHCLGSDRGDIELERPSTMAVSSN